MVLTLDVGTTLNVFPDFIIFCPIRLRVLEISELRNPIGWLRVTHWQSQMFFIEVFPFSEFGGIGEIVVKGLDSRQGIQPFMSISASALT